jgi:hypothetical protein
MGCHRAGKQVGVASRRGWNVHCGDEGRHGVPRSSQEVPGSFQMELSIDKKERISRGDWVLEC